MESSEFQTLLQSIDTYGLSQIKSIKRAVNRRTSFLKSMETTIKRKELEIHEGRHTRQVSNKDMAILKSIKILDIKMEELRYYEDEDCYDEEERIERCTFSVGFDKDVILQALEGIQNFAFRTNCLIAGYASSLVNVTYKNRTTIFENISTKFEMHRHHDRHIRSDGMKQQSVLQAFPIFSLVENFELLFPHDWRKTEMLLPSTAWKFDGWSASQIEAAYRNGLKSYVRYGSMVFAQMELLKIPFKKKFALFQRDRDLRRRMKEDKEFQDELKLEFEQALKHFEAIPEKEIIQAYGMIVLGVNNISEVDPREEWIEKFDPEKKYLRRKKIVKS